MTTTEDLDNLVYQRLIAIASELHEQKHLATKHWDSQDDFENEMCQIKEYIEEAGEYGIAYDVIIANLDQVPFQLSSKAVLGLIEVALVMGYKTEDDCDAVFDRRNR